MIPDGARSDLVEITGGAFRFDHPLDPVNRYLAHSFVESPDMMNIYNGNVTTDDRWYAEARCPSGSRRSNGDDRYQLTVIDTRDSNDSVMAQIVNGIEGGRFTLRTSAPRVRVSWQVTGVRRDAWAEAHRSEVEQDKRPEHRGRYLTPEVHGYPALLRIHEPVGIGAPSSADEGGGT